MLFSSAMSTPGPEIPALMGQLSLTNTAFLILALVIAGAVVVCAVYLMRLTERVERMHGRLDDLDQLDALHGLLAKIAADREDLDLRRLEQLLGEVRGEIRRGTEALSEAAREALDGHVGTPEVTIQPHSPVSLGERIVNRLLSLGYERVQLVTDSDVLDELAGTGEEDAPSDGEALFEAYRHGVLHKGRVLVRDGRVSDVDVHPTYSIFP